MSETTWREVLLAAQQDINDAHERRREVFRQAHDAGLTMGQIADVVDISESTVSRIMRRRRRRDDSLLDAPVLTYDNGQHAGAVSPDLNRGRAM